MLGKKHSISYTMNTYKINQIAFKTVNVIILIFLTLGALGMLLNHQYIKGLIGFSAAILVSITMLKKPTLAMWFSMIGILLLGMYIVGMIKN